VKLLSLWFVYPDFRELPCSRREVRKARRLIPMRLYGESGRVQWISLRSSRNPAPTSLAAFSAGTPALLGVRPDFSACPSLLTSDQGPIKMPSESSPNFPIPPHTKSSFSRTLPHSQLKPQYPSFDLQICRHRKASIRYLLASSIFLCANLTSGRYQFNVWHTTQGSHTRSPSLPEEPSRSLHLR
jgi:hypothetical protein